MFGSTPEENWRSVYPADNSGFCSWALRSLLIDDGTNKVLIDTGFNDFDQGVLEEYKIENFKPTSEIVENKDCVSVVIHTHLHLDHCGGSFFKHNEKFDPVFQNAEYFVSESQLYAAEKPSAFEKDSFQQEIVSAFRNYKGLKLIKSNCNLFPWLELRLFNGHTNGLIVPIIKEKNKTLVFIGDLIPSAAHLSLNSISGYDINPSLSQTERNEFLKEAHQNNYILFFQHDIINECCTIDYSGKNFIPLKTFSLSELKFSL
jgi:glyoxylase-like metal-dependent hydrolase (beta-lactamase superfamily II)